MKRKRLIYLSDTLKMFAQFSENNIKQKKTLQTFLNRNFSINRLFYFTVYLYIILRPWLKVTPYRSS